MSTDDWSRKNQFKCRLWFQIINGSKIDFGKTCMNWLLRYIKITCRSPSFNISLSDSDSSKCNYHFQNQPILLCKTMNKKRSPDCLNAFTCPKLAGLLVEFLQECCLVKRQAH